MFFIHFFNSNITFRKNPIDSYSIILQSIDRRKKKKILPHTLTLKSKNFYRKTQSNVPITRNVVLIFYYNYTLLNFLINITNNEF